MAVLGSGEIFAKYGISGILNGKDVGYHEAMSDYFKMLQELFERKCRQYSAEGPLANFRKGALLNQGEAEYPQMYVEARNYMSKHVAHVYNNGIDGSGVDESLKDIAVYSMIMLYMREKWLKGEGSE